MESLKITKSRQAGPKRRYDDACGTAHGLELIGERWALLVMRELMLGPKRFGDLRADLPGISANVLTQRLEGLEQAGLVVTEKVGRVRTCKLGPRRLEEEVAWMERHRQLWNARFDALDQIVGQLRQEEEKADGQRK